MAPARQSKFHVVVVLQEPAEWLSGCLAAAFAQTLPAQKVTLVDNLAAANPAHTTGAEIKTAFADLNVIRPPTPLSFAACCNRAAAAARDADFLLLLNQDSVPAMVLLERLDAAFRQNPNVAVMGCKVLGADVETIQHLGSEMRANAMPRHFGAGEIDTGQYSGVRDALSVQVAGLAIRTEVWCELGGLDESFWPSYFEVADFCFRARRADWRIAVACDATVTHFGKLAPDGLDAPGRKLFFQNRARFLKKHYRGGEWLARFLPDELRWLAGRSSAGLRRAAIASVLAALFKKEKVRPQTVQ